MPLPSRADVFATPADRAECREAIRQGSRSFHLAGQFLPVEVREPAFAVYAFCRMADDLIDREQGGEDAVDELRRCLDRVYARKPRRNHVERAFADATDEFSIPRDVPEALLEGLLWDAQGRRYETLSDLKGYAVRVAGSVGVMMSLIMQRRGPAVLARACDLGIAMQLTNICRDVGEDARNGRIYLPRDRLAAAGLRERDVFAAHMSDGRIASVVGDLLEEAERHYRLAGAGIVALPAGSRVGINAARLLYREIGRKVAAGTDPIRERAVVGKGRKLALLAAATRLPHDDQCVLDEACAPEAADLVAAAVDAHARRTTLRPRWWDLRGRTIRMVEMLASFEAGGRKRPLSTHPTGASSAP